MSDDKTIVIHGNFFTQQRQHNEKAEWSGEPEPQL